MKKVSLADVASSLGVSKTLVSLVLNGKGDQVGISKDTQERVHKMAAELNYKPNQFARGLRIGKSNVIGLIVSDISNAFYAKLCKSVEDYLNSKGYNLIICSSDEDPQKESYLIDMLVERQVDGLILSSSQDDYKTIRQVIDSNVPVVLYDRYNPDHPTDNVVVDNKEGTMRAIQHLVHQGHKRIGCFTISPAHISTIHDRALGYKDALNQNNISFDDQLVREIPFNNIHASVGDHLAELLSPPYSISALFTVNNNVALSVIRTLSAMGKTIPNDLALISFDDIESFELCNPPITAVVQPIADMGIESAKLLLSRIDSKKKGVDPVSICLPTELRIRQSCGFQGDRPIA